MATYPRRSIATRNRNTRSSTITHCRNLIEISFTREGFFRFHIFLYAHPSIAQPIRTPTMNPVILFTISNTAAIAPPPYRYWVIYPQQKLLYQIKKYFATHFSRIFFKILSKAQHIVLITGRTCYNPQQSM